MKIIYDDKTNALIDLLTTTIEEETNYLINHLRSRGAGTMRIQTEVQCCTRLNKMRNELNRLYAIAMPVSYEFEPKEIK